MLELPGSFPVTESRSRDSSLEDALLNKASSSCPELLQGTEAALGRATLGNHPPGIPAGLAASLAGKQGGHSLSTTQDVVDALWS